MGENDKNNSQHQLPFIITHLYELKNHVYVALNPYRSVLLNRAPYTISDKEVITFLDELVLP